MALYPHMRFWEHIEERSARSGGAALPKLDSVVHIESLRVQRNRARAAQELLSLLTRRLVALCESAGRLVRARARTLLAGEASPTARGGNWAQRRGGGAREAAALGARGPRAAYLRLQLPPTARLRARLAA